MYFIMYLAIFVERQVAHVVTKRILQVFCDLFDTKDSSTDDEDHHNMNNNICWFVLCRIDFRYCHGGYQQHECQQYCAQLQHQSVLRVMQITQQVVWEIHLI